MKITTDNFMKVCLMKIPHRRLVGVAATCFLVTGLASLPPTALAGPDQNKHTVYGTHMDLSPEAAVTGANHNLEGEDDGDGGKEITGLGVVLGLRKANEETAEYKGLPADNAVMWLPRSGYYRFNSTEQTPFVAKQGDTVWQAPQNVDASQLPIYFGYNSGSHIQKAADNEELQNQNYSLDLLKVEGPGDVEVFTQTALRATRIFSSKDKAFRSLIKPRHSHYHTTFTKPGRYVFTYQATAYDSEGEPIKTMPMNLAWQVGGEQPDKGKILDPAQAWEKATKGEVSASLSLKPSENKNTEIAFKGSGNGRLVLLIDGHFLDELPVTGGTAKSTTFLGEGSSKYQALFIPDDYSKPAWLSESFTYDRKDSKNISETGSELVKPKEIDKERVWDPQPISLEDTNVRVSIKPKDGKHILTLQGDKKLRGFASIKMFSSNSTIGAPACSAEGHFDENGKIEQEWDISACEDFKPWLHVTVIPHPLIDVKSIDSKAEEIDLSKSIEKGYKFEELDEKKAPEQIETFGSFKRGDDVKNIPLMKHEDEADTDDSDDSESVDTEDTGDDTETNKNGNGKDTDPSSPSSPSSQSSEEHKEPTVAHKHELTEGHIDIRLAKNNGKVGFNLNHEHVQRSLDDTIIRVRDNARQKRDNKLGDEKWDFLGPVGEKFYILPSSEEPGKPWPGFSSEDLNYKHYPQGVDITLDHAETPDGGRAVFYQADPLTGEVKRMLDTGDEDTRTLSTTKPLHLHGNWSFNKPGQYTLYFKATSGDKEIAAPQPVTFLVGDNATAQQPTGEDVSGKAGKAGKESKKAEKVAVHPVAKSSEPKTAGKSGDSKSPKKEDPNVKKSAIKQKLAETGSYADLLLPAALTFFGIGFAVLGLVRMRRQ